MVLAHAPCFRFFARRDGARGWAGRGQGCASAAGAFRVRGANGTPDGESLRSVYATTRTQFSPPYWFQQRVVQQGSSVQMPSTTNRYS